MGINLEGIGIGEIERRLLKSKKENFREKGL